MEQDRAIFEYNGFYRAMTDLPLLRHEMALHPLSKRAREWLAANDAFRLEVLDHLGERGPLRAAEIPDNAQASWASSGWTNNRNTMQMLEILVLRGEVAIAGRDAGGRRFDIAERVYPTGLAEIGELARWLGLEIAQ